MHNFLVIAHGASDIHPKIDYNDKIKKQTYSILLIIQLNFTIM